MANSVASLCRGNTYLDETEITLVEQMSNHLQYIADLNRADIFIDVLTKNPDEALVVAEANPNTAPSLYTQSVVGELAFKQNEPAVFKAFETAGPVWEVKGVTQEGIPVKQSVIPVQGRSNVIATLIMEQDISEEIQTEAKVELLSQTTEKLTSALLDVSQVNEVLPTILQDAVIITKQDYTVLYANLLAQQLLQTPVDKDTGENLLELIKHLVQVQEQETGEAGSNELVFNKRVFMLKHVPFIRRDQLATHVFLLRDITELRIKEKELKAKAAVIKEIHHRVKNNLHTVVSFLRLQMQRSDSDKVKQAFLSSINRISSIALIHEVLVAEDLRSIDLLPLIQEVANLSIRSTVEPGDSINVSVTGASALLPSDVATGTAMVLNELIQNAVEHGFGQGQKGLVKITVELVTGSVVITVSDDGRGLPEGFSPVKSAGLGLNIVFSIVHEKLGGKIDFTSCSGTSVRISFPLPDRGDVSAG